MNIIKTITLAGLLAGTSGPVYAGADWSAIDNAWYAGDIEQLETLRGEYADTHPKAAALIEYRLAGYQLGTGKRKRADALARQAIEHLKSYTETHPGDPDGFALLASTLGLTIGIDPSRGESVGPETGRYMSRAMEIDPNDPQVLYLNAISTLHRPAAYGGSASRAREQLDQAIAAYDQLEPGTEATWGLAEAHVWRGMALRSLGNTQAAAAEFERAMQIAPDYRWARKLYEETLSES